MRDVDASWSDGDFDDEGDVDSEDMQLVLATNQFDQGVYAATLNSDSAATFAAYASPAEPITFSAPGMSLPLMVARVQTPAPTVPVSKIEPIDRATVFGAMYTAALLADSTEQSFPSHDSPASLGPSGDLVWDASDASTGLDTGPRRLKMARPARYSHHRGTRAEVDLALTDLADELVDGHEHYRLATARHA